MEQKHSTNAENWLRAGLPPKIRRLMTMMSRLRQNVSHHLLQYVIRHSEETDKTLLPDADIHAREIIILI
jgi:hypothetical protein